LGREGTALERDLDELAELGVLQPQTSEPRPAYEFRHALIQDAVLDSLPASTRRQLHGRVAQALLERVPDLGETQPELLAHHCTESGALEEALRYWIRAGELAVQRSTLLEAIHHLSRGLEVFHKLPDASHRRQQHLQLLLALSTPLTVTHGYGHPEVVQHYERIRELLSSIGETSELGAALGGLFLNRFGMGRYPEAREVASQLTALGERLGSAELLVMGHRMLATVLFTQGEVAGALEHGRLAVENSRFMGLERHRELARKLGLDPTVSALTYASIICSVSGRLARAQQISHEALQLAQRIAHPTTQAFAFAYAATSCKLRGDDPRCVLELAHQGIALSTEHHLPMWRGWSTMHLGWARAEMAWCEQERHEGHAILKEGLEQWRAAGMSAGWPYFLGLLASVLWKLRQIPEGLAAVNEGLGWVRRIGERSSEVELHRLKGELLWEAGLRQEALDSSQRAIAVARAQGAKTFELRAATSLARQWLALGMREEARGLLESACRGFEAEPVLADMARAQELLAQLGPPSPESPSP
jgi:tetratricopeptide (TPR) repeat protein